MMTREDMMRELELLPVWQLRAPLPSVGLAASIESIQVKSIELIIEKLDEKIVEQEIVTDATELEVISELQVIKPQEFILIFSDDDDWLFIMPNAVMLIDELQLFQNICKALRIKTKSEQTSNNILSSIRDTHTKLLFVMGGTTVQTILQTSEPATNLFGKKHQVNGIALIATYDLAHLLQNPADNSKVWQDLCMGLQILQELKI